MTKITVLNSQDKAQAVQLIEPFIERAPTIAKRVADHRPFSNVEGLIQAINAELAGLSDADKITLFCAHPELAPENPLTMTGASQEEQARLNLTSAQNLYQTQLKDLNARYREKFGFPFITALVRHADMQTVLSEFHDRLTQDRSAEVREALNQIGIVSAARVRQAFPTDPVAATPDQAGARP